MPPVVVLFVAAVLILAQLFHLVFPRRITYLRRLILATLGVALGEFAGGRLLPSGPRLGDLHPYGTSPSPPGCSCWATASSDHRV